MKVLLDASVIISALVEAHPDHEHSLKWFQQVVSGKTTGYVAAHSLAESYASLTALPHRPRITAAVAQEAIRTSVVARFRVQALSTRDYAQVVRRLAAGGFTGGIVYDALLARVAEKARVDRVVTYNSRDFERLAAVFSIQVERP